MAVATATYQEKTDEQQAITEMVRQFARDEVAPVARQLDDAAKFPWDNVRKMAELGLLGIPWPEEMGGAGLDLLSYMVVLHEPAKVDASQRLTGSAHPTPGPSPSVNFRSEEQERRYVPLLARCRGRRAAGWASIRCLACGPSCSDAGATSTHVMLETKANEIDRSLWAAVRALEERAATYGRLAGDAAEVGGMD